MKTQDTHRTDGDNDASPNSPRAAAGRKNPAATQGARTKPAVASGDRPADVDPYRRVGITGAAATDTGNGAIVLAGVNLAAATDTKADTPTRTLPRKPGTRFTALGVYGFQRQELAILAALVTGDPLLLIGRSGTGKTYLLNSISEALGLEHRHYNASLIAFDDLVGFPYPDNDKQAIRFLETPATIWGAESVLVDEISRCKPEHQNRLFSLVHERRIQGIALDKLRYRWAAMNPCTTDQNGAEDYMGSEPLDPALADRFAVIVEAGDWDRLTTKDRKRIADPAGEGAVSDDGGRLRAEIGRWRGEFERRVEKCPAEILDYVCVAVNTLREAGIRLSPRRARLMSRTLLAARIVSGDLSAMTTLGLLQSSLPHQAWGEPPDRAAVAAAHRLAWDSAMLRGKEQWLHRFHLERRLEGKAGLLLERCPNPDVGTMAIEQLLANEPRELAAAFALAAYPAAVAGKLPVGAEAVNDLGRLAQELLTIDGNIEWRERISERHTNHPEFVRCAALFGRLEGPRQERARQLFYWCLVNKIAIRNVDRFEHDFHRCVRVFAEVAS